ncbi:MAG: lytic transglycosylase domain-containing protein [Comamonadaceae bacterium]|nr:MAG: lytic transglycosylase domain-containing protein [Comamonadaceae bacterium]
MATMSKSTSDRVRSPAPRPRPVWRALLLAVLAWAAPLATARAADIFGYVDDRGVAHFASERVDERYQLFFRGEQAFDTADGVAPRGRAAEGVGKTPPAAQTLMALFASSPTYRVAKAAVSEAAVRHAIDAELLQALIATESGFDAQALSPKGAVGLMQLMPGTAERYGVRADRNRSIESKLADPRINVAAGARYLRDLIAMFPGRLELALAAYNAGEGAVQRAGNRIPAYRETQNYVRTVLQLYEHLKPSRGAGPASGGAFGGGTAPRGASVPSRVRMELTVPRGGALGRGNLPTGESLRLPAATAAPGSPPAASNRSSSSTPDPFSAAPGAADARSPD